MKQQNPSKLSDVQPAHHHHLAFLRQGPKGFVMELFRRFAADQCGVWAAALSFYALLSIVPLMVGALALVGLLIHDPQDAAQQVQSFVAKLLPVSHAGEVARKLIESAGVAQQAEHLRQASGLAGLISILTFLFTASRIYVSAAAPLNAAFRAKETRNLWQINLYALGLLIGTTLLFVVSLLPAAAIHLMRQVPIFAGLPDPPPLWLAVVLFLVGIVLNAAIFTLVYRFLPSPDARVTWKMALVGGIFVAVLFEIAKQGFALYLRNFNGSSSYDRAYGSLGVVAIVFLWIYASSQLLLLGAELARLSADTKEGLKVLQRESSTSSHITRSSADKVTPERSPAREGSTGWVSKKFESSQGRVLETVLGSLFIGLMLVASFIFRRSSSGQRSS